MSPNLWWWMTIHSPKIEIAVRDSFFKQQMYWKKLHLDRAADQIGPAAKDICSFGHNCQCFCWLIHEQYSVWAMLQKKEQEGTDLMMVSWKSFWDFPTCNGKPGSKHTPQLRSFVQKNVNIVLSINSNISQIENLILVSFWLILFAKGKKKCIGITMLHLCYGTWSSSKTCKEFQKKKKKNSDGVSFAC